MTKSIDERVSDAFAGPSSAAEAKEYSQKVYSAWTDLTTALSRNAILIFLLMAIFELLAYQPKGAGITLGSFTLYNAPIVQIALPAAVAFMIYDGIRITARWLETGNAHLALVKIYAPKQVDNDLDILIRPYLSSLWGIGYISSTISSRADKFIYRVNKYVTRTMIFIIPVAFGTQAYYRLIQEFGYHDIFVWASLAIALLFAICAAIYMALLKT